MQPVRDALIVAGGLGTRMFPVSAIQPKETLPLVDIPLLTHLVMEAKSAGITRLHIILSPRKNLGDFLADRSDIAGMRPELDVALFDIGRDIEILTHIQHEAKGVGNALQCALHAVKGPMLILLGDNVLMDVHSPTTAYAPSSASRRLVEQFNLHGQATVGLMEVPENQVSHYGIVSMEGDKITNMVEKPPLSQAPSRMAMCGRYVFPDTTQVLLEKYSYEQCGDLQTIALQEHWMKEGALHGVLLDGMQWYDSGSPLLWLQAQVDHALRRPEYEESMRQWLQERLSD
ncbi:MAG TPA: sugar phosphate nucleotidyltransferase [Poseidonia sp.]|nr:sugar phosphate nucleotidyltransferase [Poseidonia sp.]